MPSERDTAERCELIWLAPLLLALPHVERISPPGGWVRMVYWDDTLSAGESYQPDPRVFVWTHATGPVWLTDLAPGIAVSARLDAVTRHNDGWRLRLCDADGAYMLHLPTDTSQWFRSGDFDCDGDVDQTDFGLWQRQIGQPGAMSRDEFLRQMSGPR